MKKRRLPSTRYRRFWRHLVRKIGHRGTIFLFRCTLDPLAFSHVRPFGSLIHCWKVDSNLWPLCRHGSDLEPEKTAPSPDIAASRAPPTTTLSSLLAAPLPTTSSSTIPVINLDPSPSKATVAPSAASNPLLEALKMKTSVPVSSTPAAATTTAGTV